MNIKSHTPLLVFILIETLVLCFIFATSNVFPDNIASHFNGAGAPNGFMPKRGYFIFISLFAIGIPSMIVIPMNALFSKLPPEIINIPNKTYWLSEQRKGQTMRFLKFHVTGLGILISFFISYIHWLLIKANSVQPPCLSNSGLFIGMGIFAFATVAWGVGLVVRFLRVPHDRL